MVFIIHIFIFFFLDKKETKNQDETPTPIFLSHENPSQSHLKNCSSLRFVFPTALLLMYARVYEKQLSFSVLKKEKN